MMKVMTIKSYYWSRTVCHDCSSWFWVKTGQSVEMPFLWLAVCQNIVSLHCLLTSVGHFDCHATILMSSGFSFNHVKILITALLFISSWSFIDSGIYNNTVHLAASVAKTLKTMEVIPVFIKLLAPEGLFIDSDIIQTHKSSSSEIMRHVICSALKKSQWLWIVLRVTVWPFVCCYGTNKLLSVSQCNSSLQFLQRATMLALQALY